MTTIKVPATTLNFDDEGTLLKSEFMGFTITQDYIETYPDTYVAYQEDVQFTDPTLSGLIASIIEHLYEKAI